MIYERYFVRICFVNPSNRVPITLIISAYFFGMALLSRDTHKPDIKCLLKLIYWKIVSFGFRPNC